MHTAHYRYSFIVSSQKAAMLAFTTKCLEMHLSLIIFLLHQGICRKGKEFDYNIMYIATITS